MGGEKMNFKNFVIVKLILLLSLLVVPISLASDSTSYDVFPLHKNLHYQYNYLRTFIAYHSLQWTDMQSDSGRIDYIVRDSLRSNDSTIIWSIDIISHIFHKHTSYLKLCPDTTFLQMDTVRMNATENLNGNHQITMPSRNYIQ